MGWDLLAFHASKLSHDSPFWLSHFLEWGEAKGGNMLFPRVAVPQFPHWEALDENNFSGLPWSSGLCNAGSAPFFCWFRCACMGQTHHINGPMKLIIFCMLSCNLFGVKHFDPYAPYACDTAQVYGQSQHSRCAEGPVLNQDQDALWPHQTPAKFITFW
jgi:hypothetical protein